MKKIRYHREARAEYDAAAAWYEDRSPGVGDDFIDAVEHAEAAIAAMPRTWPKWPNLDPHIGARRYLLDGFPFSIAYLDRENEIVVLAIAHDRRRPRYWSERSA